MIYLLGAILVGLVIAIANEAIAQAQSPESIPVPVRVSESRRQFIAPNFSRRR
jgi:hypothetical protein